MVTPYGVFRLLGIFSGLLFVSASAQSLSEQAQALVQKSVDDLHLAALSAAVSRDGEIIWSGTAGFADVDAKKPAMPTTTFRTASIAKAMTATGIMQLVEAKKIDLEASLQTYVPEFPKKDGGAILIRHLLSHTSGIRHYVGRENRPTIHYNTLIDAMDVFKDDELLFTPGTKYNYSTYGYTVLGAVIEKMSGQSYSAYMREHIWDPSGMSATHLEISGTTDPNQAMGYRRGKDGAFTLEAPTDLSVKYPGGGIVSTPEDLVRFAAAFESGRLLSHDKMDAMFVVPAVEGKRNVEYGLGWITGISMGNSTDLGKFHGHDGGQDGCSTNLVIWPQKGLAVAVMSNVTNVGPDIHRITRELADLVTHSP